MIEMSGTVRKLTRKETKDIDIENSFFKGLELKGYRDIDLYRSMVRNYHRQQKVPMLHEALENCLKLEPNNPIRLFDLACSCSRLAGLVENDAKQSDELLVKAIEYLALAVKKGFSDFEWILKDPDLHCLRQSPRYRKFAQKIENRRA